MPIYEMECPECLTRGDVFCKMDERLSQKCDCGATLEIKITAPNFVPFHGGFHEHIDHEPIYIKSKRQLQQECRRRGLTSMYAEGGTIHEI